MERLVKNEEDRDNLIQQVSGKIDAVIEENGRLRDQLITLQKSTAEIIQHFEGVQQKPEPLKMNLNVCSEAEIVEVDKGKGKSNKLHLWKVLFFILSYIANGISSNAIANRWPTSDEAWVLAITIFLISLAILVSLGSIGLRHLYIHQKEPKNESED